MSMYAWVQMLTEMRRQHQVPQNWGYRWLWVTPCDLGTELESFTRAIHAFSQWAASPALHSGVCFILNSLNIGSTSMVSHLKMLQSESLASRMSPSLRPLLVELELHSTQVQQASHLKAFTSWSSWVHPWCCALESDTQEKQEKRVMT